MAHDGTTLTVCEFALVFVAEYRDCVMDAARRSTASAQANCCCMYYRDMGSQFPFNFHLDYPTARNLLYLHQSAHVPMVHEQWTGEID